jgi:hypothetical protein
VSVGEDEVLSTPLDKRQAAEMVRIADDGEPADPPWLVEYELRKIMWLTHGHYGIYGDDGEMQCGECIPFGCYDYKNAPLADVRKAYNAACLVRGAE